MDMNNFPNFNFNFNFFNPKPVNPANPAMPNAANNVPPNPDPVSKDIFKPMFQNTPKEAQQNPPVQENLTLDFEMAKLDNEALLKYIQSALKMPQTLEKFIQSANIKVLKVLVKNMIDTKVLGDFLNQNSTLAIEKILKTIASSIKSGATDVSQLKDILGILTSIQSQTNLNTNAIKELLLLYIPLNPMVFDKQVDFSPASKDIEEQINSSIMSIIFETVNFSNILCCINSSNNVLYVEIDADKSFPFERFSKIIQTVAKEISFNVELEAKHSRKINSKEPAKTRNFRVFSGGFVPTEVLLLASIIIKTVFKADESYNKEEPEENQNK